MADPSQTLKVYRKRSLWSLRVVLQTFISKRGSGRFDCLGVLLEDVLHTLFSDRWADPDGVPVLFPFCRHVYDYFSFA